MYDKVNSEFKPSQTTTAFVEGPKAIGKITHLYKASSDGTSVEEISELHQYINGEMKKTYSKS